MDNRNYYDAKNLINKIDRLSQSADNSVQAIEDFKKSPETAKLYIGANGHVSTITLTKDLAIKFLEEVLESYNLLIKEAQKEVNDIINNAIREPL